MLLLVIPKIRIVFKVLKSIIVGAIRTHNKDFYNLMLVLTSSVASSFSSTNSCY